MRLSFCKFQLSVSYDTNDFSLNYLNAFYMNNLFKIAIDCLNL